jgi:hypothetical protein
MVKCGVLFEVRTEFLNKHLDELRLQMVKHFVWNFLLDRGGKATNALLCIGNMWKAKTTVTQKQRFYGSPFLWNFCVNNSYLHFISEWRKEQTKPPVLHILYLGYIIAKSAPSHFLSEIHFCIFRSVTLLRLLLVTSCHAPATNVLSDGIEGTDISDARKESCLPLKAQKFLAFLSFPLRTESAARLCWQYWFRASWNAVLCRTNLCLLSNWPSIRCFINKVVETIKVNQFQYSLKPFTSFHYTCPPTQLCFYYTINIICFSCQVSITSWPKNTTWSRIKYQVPNM